MDYARIGASNFDCPRWYRTHSMSSETSPMPMGFTMIYIWHHMVAKFLSWIAMVILACHIHTYDMCIDISLETPCIPCIHRPACQSCRCLSICLYYLYQQDSHGKCFQDLPSMRWMYVKGTSVLRFQIIVIKLYPLVICYMYCMLLHNYGKSSLFHRFSIIYEGHMFHRKLSNFQRVLQLHHPKEKLQSIKIFLDTAWQPSDVSGANWRCHVYPKLLCYPHSPCLLLEKVKFKWNIMEPRWFGHDFLIGKTCPYVGFRVLYPQIV